jgi:predicted hotdog family 3-hydroxylacyl-ACP dehydratase
MTTAAPAGFRLLRLDIAPAATTEPAPTYAPAEGAAPSASAATSTTAPTATSTPTATPAPLPASPPPFAVAELSVPADSPIFAGHFPGRPLLPGVAHLALLRLVLRELAARGGLPNAHVELPGDLAGDIAIAEVRKLRVRLNAVSNSGDSDVAARDVIRFELWRQPGANQPIEMASEGTVRIGAGRPPGDELVPRQGLALGTGLPPVAGLLPHAPPALLLATVLAASAGGIVCEGVIPAAHPLAEGGEAPGFLAIELAAQAAAAFQALVQPPVGGGPRIGYLVGVRGAHLSTVLPADRALRVSAVPAGGAAALANYDMQVSAEDGGGCLAAGAISTFLPES